MGIDKALDEVTSVYSPSDPFKHQLPTLRFDGRATGDGVLVAGSDIALVGGLSVDRVWWAGEFRDGSLSWGAADLRSETSQTTNATPYITGIDFSRGVSLSAPPLLAQATLRLVSPLPELTDPTNNQAVSSLILPSPGVDVEVILGSTVEVSAPYQIRTDVQREANGVPIANAPVVLYETLEMLIPFQWRFWIMSRSRLIRTIQGRDTRSLTSR